jgi:hypothetical protein
MTDSQYKRSGNIVTFQRSTKNIIMDISFPKDVNIKKNNKRKNDDDNTTIFSFRKIFINFFI